MKRVALLGIILVVLVISLVSAKNEVCNIETSVPLSSSIKLFFQIPLESCGWVNFCKIFFNINEVYEIDGIRWFTVVLMFVLLVIISFLKSNGVLNKLIIQKLKEPKEPRTKEEKFINM